MTTHKKDTGPLYINPAWEDPGGPEARAMRQHWREDFGWRLGDPLPEDREGGVTEAGARMLAAKEADRDR